MCQLHISNLIYLTRLHGRLLIRMSLREWKWLNCLKTTVTRPTSALAEITPRTPTSPGTDLSWSYIFVLHELYGWWRVISEAHGAKSLYSLKNTDSTVRNRNQVSPITCFPAVITVSSLTQCHTIAANSSSFRPHKSLLVLNLKDLK